MMMLRTGMITLTLIGMLRTGRKREKRGEREAGLLMMGLIGLIGGEGSPLPTSSSSINIIIIMIISQRGERALFEEMIVA